MRIIIISFISLFLEKANILLVHQNLIIIFYIIALFLSTYCSPYNHCSSTGLKGMTFDHDFCYFILLFFLPFFRRDEKRGRELPKAWSKVKGLFSLTLLTIAFINDCRDLYFYFNYCIESLLFCWFAASFFWIAI
jgi:hypothetical protein